MIKLKLKRFIIQTPIWQASLLSLLSLLGSVIALYLIVPVSDRILILHYSIPFGIDLVGQWYQLYYLPLFGAILFFSNTILAYFLIHSHRTLARSVVIVTTLAIVILTTALTLILNQNTF